MAYYDDFYAEDQVLTIVAPATNIVLIGNNEDLKNFVARCKTEDTIVSPQEIIDAKRGVRCFAHEIRFEGKRYALLHLDLARLGEKNYFEKIMERAQGFIYLQLSVEQLTHFEKYRDADQCIAVDFFANNIEPLDWLRSINKLCSFQPQVAELFNQNLFKAALIKRGTATEGVSFFTNLPPEVTSYISLLTLMTDIIVPSICCKPVYVGLPSEMFVQKLLTEPKKEQPKKEQPEVDEEYCHCALI